MSIFYKKKPFWKALFLSVFFILLSFCCAVRWETSDDPAIVYLLTLKNNDFTLFQWKYLTWILRWLYLYFPVTEWWAVNSFFAIWLGVFASFYVIFNRFLGWRAYAVNGILAMILWECVFPEMNFTRTAAAIAMGGSMFVADSLLRKSRIDAVEYALGCILLLYGAAIRFPSALIALAFLAVLSGIWLLFQKFQLRLSWFQKHKKQILGLCLSACILFGVNSVNNLLYTPEQKTYKQYNNLRSEIQDVISMYLSYESAEQELQAAGFDRDTWDLLANWLSEDTQIMNNDALKKATQLRNNSFSYQMVIYTFELSMSQLYMVVLLLFALIFVRKDNIIRIIPIAGFAMCCVCVLVYTGRIPERVFESILLCTACASAFLAGDDTFDCTTILDSVSGTVKGQFAWRMMEWGVFGLATLMCINPVKNDWLYAYQNYAKLWQEHALTEKRDATLDVVHEDTDYLYIYDPEKPIYPMCHAFSVWEPRPIGYCENYIALGGWDARHPSRVEVLQERGILNPVSALFEREDIYGTYSPRLLNYLRQHYDDSIVISEAFKINGVPIVYYSHYKDDSNMNTEKQIAVVLKEFYQAEEYSEVDAWYISIATDMLQSDDPVLYCNINEGDSRYTYRLKYDGKKASAYLYGLGKTFDPDKAELSIFEHTGEDEYIMYTIE